MSREIIYLKIDVHNTSTLKEKETSYKKCFFYKCNKILVIIHYLQKCFQNISVFPDYLEVPTAVVGSVWSWLNVFRASI